MSALAAATAMALFVPAALAQEACTCDAGFSQIEDDGQCPGTGIQLKTCGETRILCCALPAGTEACTCEEGFFQVADDSECPGTGINLSPCGDGSILCCGNPEPEFEPEFVPCDCGTGFVELHDDEVCPGEEAIFMERCGVNDEEVITCCSSSEEPADPETLTLAERRTARRAARREARRADRRAARRAERRAAREDGFLAVGIE